MDLATGDVTKLRDLVTTSVVSVSASAAWLTFWFGRRDKHEERLNRERRVLDALERQLDTIRNWAGAEYGETSHDDSWFNPFWTVLPFPSTRIERFPQTRAAEFFGTRLATAIVDLRAAVENFRSLLARHNQFLGTADAAMRTRLLAAVGPMLPQNGGRGLTLRDVAQLPNLSDDDRAWLRELYRMNQEVHTLGIGKAGEVGKLHHARAVAAEELNKARKKGPRRVVYSILSWIGHVFAGAFAVAGGYFLYLAVTAFIAEHGARCG